MNLDLGHTRLIMRRAEKLGVLRNQLAYILATAYWETARTMLPVRETLADTDAKAISRLNYAWRNGQLPWVKSDYWSGGFFGRGFVQLTHRANYERAGRELGAGVDMVAEPWLALEPDLAARVLVRGMLEGWFTGRHLGEFVTLQKSDFTNARRVVNGTDKAAEIAELARGYDDALQAEGYGEETIFHPDPAEQPGGILARILAALRGIFGKGTA